MDQMSKTKVILALSVLVAFLAMLEPMVAAEAE
jgi:hypothetical protein